MEMYEINSASAASFDLVRFVLSDKIFGQTVKDGGDTEVLSFYECPIITLDMISSSIR